MTASNASSPKLGRDIGIVDERCSYSRARFMAITGMTRASLTSAVRAGLRVCRVGKRVFILGRHWSEFLAERPTEKKI